MKGTIIVAMLVITTICFAITGSGNVIKENREVTNFNSIILSISADVTIMQSDEFFCEVSAEDNLMEYLMTEVEDETLKISFKKRTSIRSHKGINIRVSMPDVESLKIEGSGDIMSEGMIKGDKLSAMVDGSGDIKLDLEYDNVSINISGSGDAKLEGTAGSCNVSVNGSGDVMAFDLSTTATSVTINGSGDVKISVDKALSVGINGSGDVHYRGAPESISQSVNGSGDVIRVGNEKLN